MITILLEDGTECMESVRFPRILSQSEVIAHIQSNLRVIENLFNKAQFC